MNYSDVFQFISSEFKKAKIKFVLVGGFALGAYGVGRHTSDLDLMIASADIEKVRRLLPEFGFQEVVETSLFCRFISQKKEYLDIDLLFVGEQTLKKILQKKKRMNLSGVGIPIPSQEHLIALKLHSIKNNPSREWPDLFDIMQLIRENQISIRSSAFRKMCKTYGPTGIYEKIKETVK